MQWNRLLLPGCILLVLPLAGCPSQPEGAPAAKSAQALAPVLPPASPQRQAAPAPPPPTAEQQRVRALIGQVDAAYARGEVDYRKGMLAEAKVEFDRAVEVARSTLPFAERGAVGLQGALHRRLGVLQFLARPAPPARP